jgi:hypothetical protein
MTSRASRRGKAKQKRVRASQRRAAARDVDLPRALRLMVEAHDDLASYVEAATDAASASQQARVDLDASIQAIIDKMAGHDSLDLLEGIVLTNLLSDPETYREADHEGSTAIVELVALIAGSRSVIEASGKPGDYDIRKQPDIDAVQTAALKALSAASMWRLFEAGETGDALSGLGLHLAVRDAHVRNTAYPQMLRDTLDKLFSDAGLISDCVSVMGVTPEQILTVLDALTNIRQRRWNARIGHWANLVERSRQWQSEGAPTDAARQVEEALTHTWASPSEAAVIDSAEIALETGMETREVEIVLDLFTCDVSGQDADDLVHDFFSGANPLRRRPLLRHSSGRRVVTHDAMLVPAVREAIEKTLKSANRVNAYYKQRAAIVEQEAVRFLASIFPTATVHEAFEYFIPDPAKPSETTPATYTKLVESDGLLLIDDVAVVVEAKSGALSDKARSGNRARLRSDLKGLVTSASDQAARMRKRILDDGKLRLRDGTIIDLDHVREVYTVAVTLEDLTGLVTVTDDLVLAGLVPTDFLPWIVSLHDLRIVSELVERPAEFLLFLRRRTLPELTRRFIAIDELDLFLHLLRTGLYVEPDPAVLAAEMPHLPVTTSQRRKFKEQRTEFLTSRTGPLDDWYAYRTGQRTTPAPKPAINAEPEILALVDQITAAQEKGWLSTTTCLISADTALRRKFATYGPLLADATRRDGDAHTMTTVIGERAQSVSLVCWLSRPNAVQPSHSADFDTYYLEYLVAKKYQLQAARAAMLVFTQDGAYSNLLFDNRRPGSDPVLDADVLRRNLRPLTEMNGAVSTMRLKDMRRRPRGTSGR